MLTKSSCSHLTMQSRCISPPSLHVPLPFPRPFLGFRPQTHFFPSPTSLTPFPSPRVSCNFSRDRRRRQHEEALKAKKKDNVWSIDNELAAKSSTEEKKGPVRRRRKNGRRVKRVRGRGRNDLVMVSAAMLMEIETVLQTQEPVIKPAWNTFSSSVSGIWKGVGAVFSPFTAEMEPIGVGNQNENLYDCYTLSRIERTSSEGLCSHIQRKTNWVALNPFGEKGQHAQGSYRDNDRDRSVSKKVTSDVINTDLDLPSYESFDFGKSEVLEEDSMSMEPGLVFFEDGSYSRGPVDIPVGNSDESKYFLSPTFKFEQCLVKGCHKRLRIVHTIEFSEGGSDIQIIRVAVYEEQWVSPVNLYEGQVVVLAHLLQGDHAGMGLSHQVSTMANSNWQQWTSEEWKSALPPEKKLQINQPIVCCDDLFDLKPVSQRRRTQPSELAGSWKVFEVSAIPIFSEEEAALEEGSGPPYVYLCTETLTKRSLPENPAYFGEEEMLDMKDVTVLWLPGGVTAYVDVNKDGILCIGVGWYSAEGINLVMERDYGTDGKLKEVRSKSEVKRRWTDSSSSRDIQ